MTQDRFEYYSDEDFEWTGILEHYQSPDFIHKKGTKFSIELTVDEQIDEIESFMIISLASHWTWEEDRRIRAFKLEEHRVNGGQIYLLFNTLRKSQRYDEIKYFLFDLGGFLVQCEYKINEIIVKEIVG